MTRRNLLFVFAVGASLGALMVSMFGGGPTAVAPVEVVRAVSEPTAASSPIPVMIPEAQTLLVPEPLEGVTSPAAAPSKGRDMPDRMLIAQSWKQELEASRIFDAERLASKKCFSRGDVEWIQARWEEFDESRVELLARVNEGETSEGEREWSELKEALAESVGDTGYSGYLHATRQNNAVLVANMRSGSRAEDAGVKNRDRVLRYNGVRIHRTQDLADLVEGEFYADVLEVEVRRLSGSGEIETLMIEPGPFGVFFRSYGASPCPEE